MCQSLCVRFACALAVIATGCTAISPGATSALYSDMTEASDFELNLHPPEESAKDIEESLDVIMSSENLNRKASEADFAADKERMIEAEKVAIRELVGSALQPALAKLTL